MQRWVSLGILYLLLVTSCGRSASAQSRPLPPREPQVQVADQLLALGMQFEKTALDCSHFVNYLLQRVGLAYDYEPSRVLYRGAAEFQRVKQPSPGDLIVWPGHVGIVVDPDAKTFLSALHRGVKVASYTSKYWRRRGHPRFLRYDVAVPEPTWRASDDHQGTWKDWGLQ